MTTSLAVMLKIVSSGPPPSRMASAAEPGVRLVPALGRGSTSACGPWRVTAVPTVIVACEGNKCLD
ncbi:MAG: hypothetical protein H6658_00140 [Ardenticatenaceae bacterium]|nr:hypothetical protein [Ardenticatenaceae bacterium]